MKEENKYLVYIDTFSDKAQNPSKFKIKLSNWFMRNNIKNSDSSKKEWFMSVKSLAMLNSFNNITKDINDTIVVYKAKSLQNTTSPNELTGLQKLSLYDIYELKLEEGNPNVSSLENATNALLIANNLGFRIKYIPYSSKFQITILQGDPHLYYIHFYSAAVLYGFDVNKYYQLVGGVQDSFRSETNVNLLSDRLLKFELATNSDFRIKNMNYTNINFNWFQDCNIFHLQPVNVDPYRLIYYTRNTNELIPIELHKNSITDFQINVINQDGDDIEGLAHWIMVLEFTQVKTWNYDMKIFTVVKEIYMWIAMFFKNKI
jgi:hypothetical protein